MKRYLPLSILLVGCCSLNIAMANSFDNQSQSTPSGLYARLDGGLAIPTGNMNTGFDFGGAVGYTTGSLRGEGAINYIRNGKDGAHLSATTIMANVYYDYLMNSMTTVYIGGGLGLGHLSASGNIMKMSGSSANKLAYQAIVGLRYQIKPHVLTDASYHFMGMSSFDSKYNIINIGLTYLF